MKNKKIIAATLAALLLSASLVSCSNNENTNDTGTNGNEYNEYSGENGTQDEVVDNSPVLSLQDIYTQIETKVGKTDNDSLVVMTLDGYDITYSEYRYYYINYIKEFANYYGSDWDSNEEYLNMFDEYFNQAIKMNGLVSNTAAEKNIALTQTEFDTNVTAVYDMITEQFGEESDTILNDTYAITPFYMMSNEAIYNLYLKLYDSFYLEGGEKYEDIKQQTLDFYNENNVPTDPMAYYGNSESELFWNQIDIDLKFATEHLPPSYEASELGRITKGAAYALWGKVKLWKHYYYYIENDLEGTAEATQNLADAKTYLNWVITSGLYELQGEPGGSNPAVTKQDYLNALTSNFAFIDIEMPGGKVYASENNVESIWEVQYNSEKRGDGWLPAWQWGGAKNYQFFGVHNSSYKNQEMDPDAFYVYDETAAGMPAFDAGFDRDPRAYATFFLDETPTHEADLMDWRDNGYNVAFRSAANSKGTVMKQHLYQGTMPLGTGGIMRKKYSFPQFTTADASVAAPNCDPFNYRVIRFADVLLMYAEACYLSGSDETAGLSALNRVRLRAGMNTVDALSEAVIIKERDMELMGESFRFLDIVRWSRDSRWFNAINFSSNTPLQYDFLTNFTKYTTPDPKYPYRLMYMPIPQTEINKNGGQLKQNPGW